MASSNVNILTSLGASQIDTQSLVDSLVTAQKAPRQATLDAEKKKADVAISNIALLKNALTNLQSAATEIGGVGNLSKLSISSTSPGVANAVASGSGFVSPGTLTLRVSGLAAPQRTVSSPMSDGEFPLTQAVSMVVTQAGSSYQISIPRGSTLMQARNTINDQISKAGGNINCTVVNNGKAPPNGPNVLVLEGQYGKDQAFTVSGDGLGFQIDASHSGPQNLAAAADALVSVNGVEIERPTNSISDAVTGLTLQLNSAMPGQDVQISTNVDAAAISSNIKNFVDTFNGLTEFLNKVTGQPVQGDDMAGSLANDANVRAMKNTLRSVMLAESSGKSGSVTHWASIGVAFDRDGVLQFDASRLKAAISSNFSDVVKSLSNGAPTPYLYSGLSSGMAGDVAVKAFGFLKTTGIVPTMEKGFKDTLTRVGKKQDQLNQYISKLSDNYQRQFTAMNAALSSFNNTKTQLTNFVNANNRSN